MNACTLVIHHSQKFNIVKDEAETPTEGQVTLDGQTYDSLGEYKVLGPQGEETRQKILMDDPDPESVTTVEIPEGFEDTPTALTHLSEMLLDRHAPGEAVTGVSSPNNVAFAKRVAALMGVDYINEKGALA